MPKYIKDGAYTIVVDERSLSTKRTKSPNTIGSDTDDDFDNESETHHEESKEDNNVEDWPMPDEEQIIEEEIDYTNTDFILQNLSIVKPNFDNDKTFLLHGRRDLAQIITSQVRFYCYCAIDAFSRNPKVGTILVIGEGFVGASIINDLIANGCREMLRICTRGDLTAAEWRTRNVKADNDLPTLLDGVAPDIIILAVENASFAAICRQMTSHYIVTPSTFVISCSFGFQRRKLFTQLRTPNIFRTFVEPEEIFSVYKKKTFSSILNFTKSGKEVPAPAPVTPSAGLAKLPEGVTSREEFNGASFLATRSLDIRNIIYQLENFYAIHHHGFSEARNKALKNVLGYIVPPPPGILPVVASPPVAAPVGGRRNSSADETFEQMSIRKAMKTEAKLKAKVENSLKKLSTCNACLFTYQHYFASLVTEGELHALKNQQFTYEENNPKSGPNLGYERHRTPAKGARPRSTVADLPGKAMYDEDFMEAIFRNDEDYSKFTGPGFELMSTWDAKPIVENNTLKMLHDLSDDAGAAAAAAATAAKLRNTRRVSKQGAELDEAARKEVEEFGRRLSNYVDTESTNIDRNYMQSYLEASQNGGFY